MTLIALVDPERYPVLLGDVLISNTYAPSEVVDLPTIGTLPAGIKPDGMHYIYGTEQKVCILTDRLAVAWAGRSVYAKHVLRCLKEQFQKTTPTISELQRALGEIDSAVLQELSLICLLLDENTISTLCMNVTEIDVPLYGRCYVAGSGSGPFIEKLFRQWSTSHLKGVPNHAEGAILSTLALITDIIADEVSRLTNFEFGFGGGVEVAVCDGKQIRKVGDISMLFSHYDLRAPDSIGMSDLIIKVDYSEDNLIVRRLDQPGNNPNQTLPRLLYGYRLYAVPSFDAKSGTIEVNLDWLPNINGTFLLHHVFIHEGGKLLARVPFASWRADRSGPLCEEASQDRRIFSLQRNYLDQLIHFVEQAARMRPTQA